MGISSNLLKRIKCSSYSEYFFSIYEQCLLGQRVASTHLCGSSHSQYTLLGASFSRGTYAHHARSCQIITTCQKASQVAFKLVIIQARQLASCIRSSQLGSIQASWLARQLARQHSRQLSFKLGSQLAAFDLASQVAFKLAGWLGSQLDSIHVSYHSSQVASQLAAFDLPSQVAFKLVIIQARQLASCIRFSQLGCIQASCY